MKGNHDACHLPLSSKKSSNIQIENFTIKYSKTKTKKLRGINFDLKFDIHVENICPKANGKLNALVRIANYMELPKKPIFILFLKFSFIIVLLFGCFIAVSKPFRALYTLSRFV